MDDYCRGDLNMKRITQICIVALMIMLINQPIMAQKSWFERNIAPWVPFLLTKNFIEHELAQPKEEMQKLDKDVERLNGSIFNIYERLRGLGKRIFEYSNTFKDSQEDTRNQFARAQHGLAEVATFNKSLGDRVSKNNELLFKTANNVTGIKSAVDEIRDAAYAHRTSSNHILDEIKREQTTNRAILKSSITDHFTDTNKRLDTAWALIESNRRTIKELVTKVDTALTTAQQREEEQKNITQQIEKLREHAQMQSKKVNEFNRSFAQFQQAFNKKKDRFFADAELAEASKHQIFTNYANKI